MQKLVDVGISPMATAIYGTLGNSPWSPDGRTLYFTRLDEQSRMAIWKHSGRDIEVKNSAERQPEL